MVSQSPASCRPAAAPSPSEGRTTAYRLSQLGAHVSQSFDEQLAEVGLTAIQAGLLRLVAGRPGCSQQAAASGLGARPSRLVTLVDELQERGLLERRRNETDRRHHALHLTSAGERVLAEALRLGGELDRSLTGVLDPAEHRLLGELLERLAAVHGLTDSAHPAFRLL